MEARSMIPCIGVAIVNRPDLWERLVRSIDFPVGEFFTVENANVGLPVVENPNIQHRPIYQPEGNVGCSGAWNIMLWSAFVRGNHSHVLIVGNDIQFAPGDLEMFDRAFSEHPEADFINGNHSFSTFALSRKGHEKLGWFDENFRMAYAEDSDFWRRIVLSKATVVSLPTNSIHGEPPHFQSTTIHSDPDLYRVVKAQQEVNWTYFIRKWGARRHVHASETFVHPFNDPNWPLNKWELATEWIGQPHFRSHG